MRSVWSREAPSGKEIRTGSEVGGTGVVTVVGVGAGSTRGAYEYLVSLGSLYIGCFVHILAQCDD